MKRKFKLTKLNIISIAILACVGIIIAAAGGSIAFFTDAKETTNVFTAGSVYISLSEAAVKSDGAGNLIEDTAAQRITGNDIADTANIVKNEYGKIFPGQTIHKDPTIKNTGKDPAWIAAKIIISDGDGDISELYGDPVTGYICITDLLCGGLLDEQVHVGVWNQIRDVSYNDNYAMIQASDTANDRHEFYIYINSALDPDASVMLFDTLAVDPEFGNAEMRELAQLNITVQAFAVQKVGFESCYEAMHRAFPEHFSPSASIGG